ncbi:DsbA family protein [Sporolactobacillus sp. THM7-7]|nr:DsbA family protein [Sporolactobacillus sp. THM7-7]
MTRYEERAICEGIPGHMTCSISRHSKNDFRRVEILAFIDPLCAECWGLEPLMKKFFVEYHDYFTIKFVLTTKHSFVNRCPSHPFRSIAEEWDKYACLTGMCCNSDVWYENPPSPFSIALAIKAAEFQGKHAANRFLRRIREQIFLRKNGLNRFDELLEVARLAELNLEEFNNDFHSKRPIKALKGDRRLAQEFSITELPSLVFSTAEVDEEAVKVSGHYEYQVYVQILTDLLGKKPIPRKAPQLQQYFKENLFLTTKEVSVVYDLSEEHALKELRKLQLQQVIEPITIKSGTFWKYIAG